VKCLDAEEGSSKDLGDILGKEEDSGLEMLEL